VIGIHAVADEPTGTLSKLIDPIPNSDCSEIDPNGNWNTSDPNESQILTVNVSKTGWLDGAQTVNANSNFSVFPTKKGNEIGDPSTKILEIENWSDSEKMIKSVIVVLSPKLFN
jgi:hypothetical protein